MVLVPIEILKLHIFLDGAKMVNSIVCRIVVALAATLLTHSPANSAILRVLDPTVSVKLSTENSGCATLESCAAEVRDQGKYFASAAAFGNHVTANLSDGFIKSYTTARGDSTSNIWFGGTSANLTLRFVNESDEVIILAPNALRLRFNASAEKQSSSGISSNIVIAGLTFAGLVLDTSGPTPIVKASTSSASFRFDDIDITDRDKGVFKYIPSQTGAGRVITEIVSENMLSSTLTFQDSIVIQPNTIFGFAFTIVQGSSARGSGSSAIFDSANSAHLSMTLPNNVQLLTSGTDVNWISAVPESSTMGLLLFGTLLIGLKMRTNHPSTAQREA